MANPSPRDPPVTRQCLSLRICAVSIKWVRFRIDGGKGFLPTAPFIPLTWNHIKMRFLFPVKYVVVANGDSCAIRIAIAVATLRGTFHVKSFLIHVGMNVNCFDGLLTCLESFMTAQSSVGGKHLGQKSF